METSLSTNVTLYRDTIFFSLFFSKASNQSFHPMSESVFMKTTLDASFFDKQWPPKTLLNKRAGW